MNLTETEYDGDEWIQLAQVMDQFRVLATKVMRLWEES
jgi:hypothetical protein